MTVFTIGNPGHGLYGRRAATQRIRSHPPLSPRPHLRCLRRPNESKFYLIPLRGGTPEKLSEGLLDSMGRTTRPQASLADT
jgi:hypothetical protein